MQVCCKEKCSGKHDLMFYELLFSAKIFLCPLFSWLLKLHHFVVVLMTMNVIVSVEIII